ncbi:MAG: hypothetical protein NTU58_01950 [Candidatus Nealsonbacteria bacterium]|nr:hypothetical protein [Candidatus Nealsonbacteria bacterium]
MNKKISTPLAIGIILILSVALGSFTFLQHKREIDTKIGEIISLTIQTLDKKAKERCFARCSFTNEKAVIWTESDEETDPRESKDNLYLMIIPEKRTIKVTKEPAIILSKFLSEDKIVWVESRDNRKEWKMYFYDINTEKQEELISIRAREYRAHKDKIIIKKIIDDFNPNQELVLFDINTKKMKPLLKTSTGYSCFVGRKNKVIFREDRKFYLYDIETDKKEALPEELNGSATCLEIYDNNIVYSKVFNVEEKQTEPIEAGNIIIYPSERFGMEPESYIDIDNRNGTVKLFLYNLLNKETKELKEITVPKVILGSFMNMGVSDIRIIKNEVKYLTKINKWIGPDIDDSIVKCLVIDIDTKKEKDITCKGGILSWR